MGGEGSELHRLVKGGHMALGALGIGGCSIWKMGIGAGQVQLIGGGCEGGSFHFGVNESNY